MLKIRLLPALAVCLLAGCTAQGPAFTEAPPPGTKALVYLYRPYNKWMSTQDAGFDANGKRVGFLDPGGYTFFHAAPGHYDIKQFWPVGVWSLQAPTLLSKDLDLPVDLKAGETRYFRLSIDGNIGVGGYNTFNMQVHWVLTEVPGVIARREITEQKFEPQNKAMPAEFRP
jgi:hypothetical protein